MVTDSVGTYNLLMDSQTLSNETLYNYVPNPNLATFGVAIKEMTDKLKPFVEQLEAQTKPLRDYLEVPVSVTGSGYRTKKHNDKVGGAKNSQHLTASGADINAEGYEPKQLAEVIELLILQGKMKQGGIGVYPNFVHYDIRGTKARW